MNVSRWVLGILLLANALAISGEPPSADELKTWADYYDSTFYARQAHKEMSAEQRFADLRFESNAVAHTSRLNAALLLNISVPKEAEILRALLEDPAPAIRCAAARSLFGEAADAPEFAARYKYESVLVAEKQAHEIFTALPKLSLSDQFSATRRLGKLGFDAIHALRAEFTNPDPCVVLSAFIVSRRFHDNINPRWFTELEQKMQKPITIKFDNAPLSECVRFVSVLTGARISVKQKAGEDPWINLQVSDMPAETVLKWVARLADMELDYRDGELCMAGNGVIACGSEAVWLHDVRDLTNPEDMRQLDVALKNFTSEGFVEMRIWNGFAIAESLPLGMNGIHLMPVFDEVRKKKAERAK